MITCIENYFFVAFIGIVALALWLTFFTLPVFNIKTIEINGNENLSKEQIESMLNTKVGNNIFAFNKTKALKNIKSNNYIEEVSIHRKLPSTITVDIKEYKLRAMCLIWVHIFILMTTEEYWTHKRHLRSSCLL